MISDDALGDLVGAKELGMRTTLVLSGKCKTRNEVLHVNHLLDGIVETIGSVEG